MYSEENLELDVLFSCIVPTLNEIETIRPFIESIYSQDYRPIELIIVDGGSTDGTCVVVRECIAELNDFSFLIKLFREIDFGIISSPANARNIGLDNSTGELILFIDCDTVFIDKCTISKAAYEMGSSDYIFIPFEIIIDTPLEERISRLLNADGTLFYRKEFIGDLRFIATLGFGEDREFNYRLFRSVKSMESIHYVSTSIGRHFPHYYNELKGQSLWYGRTIFRYVRRMLKVSKLESLYQILYILLNVTMAMLVFISMFSIIYSFILSFYLLLAILAVSIIRLHFKIQNINNFIFATWYYIYTGIYFTKGIFSSLNLKGRAGR